MPRHGHFEAALHIMGYLKLRHNSRLVFDPSYPDTDPYNFCECDWADFYDGLVEAIPTNTSPQRGKEVDLWMFVDSNNAVDKWTSRSRTLFMIYMNMSLINCYSKKQSTIETSVFGTEFVAIKPRVEILHAFWYKLRTMGIPISGASCVYGDNMSIIHNTSTPEWTLKKTCNDKAYHAICKSMAMGEILA